MVTVSVCRLDHNIIRRLRCLRVFDDRLLYISHIAGKDDLLTDLIFCDPYFNAGRSKQMTDICKTDVDSLTELNPHPVITRCK